MFGFGSRKNKQQQFNLARLDEATTLQDCEDLQQIFSKLTLDEQAVIMKTFQGLTGAIVHLGLGRSKDVKLGNGWKIVNDDGYLHMIKVANDSIQVDDLSLVNNKGTGKFVYRGYTVSLLEGNDKHTVLITSPLGLTDSFRTDKLDKLDSLIKMKIGKMEK